VGKSDFTVRDPAPHPRNARIDGWGENIRLEEILSVRVARKVADDHTVSWTETAGACHGKKSALVYGSLGGNRTASDGSHWLRFRNRYLRLRPCPEPAPRAVSPSGLRPPGLTAHQYQRPERVFLRSTHGGHFNMAENRTFLLCVDTHDCLQRRRRSSLV